MVRVTLVSDKNKSNGKLLSEDLIIEETQLDGSPDQGRSGSPKSSASSIVFEMSINQFVEVTNILQCFFELSGKKKCHFSNVSSNQQGGDATIRQETIWPRFIKPKRVVTCGRKTLLAWVNTELCECYTDLSQLNDGVAFCRLINSIAPGIIPRSKIKFYIGITRWTDNFKLLQQAFVDLRIERALPGKGKELNPREILMFTSWLKAFIDINSQLTPRGKTTIEEGVGDCSSCKDSGCGSGTCSDSSEDRQVNAPPLNIIERLDRRERTVQKNDELKSDHKEPPFYLTSQTQLSDTQSSATFPIQNSLSNDSVSTEIPNKPFVPKIDHPTNLISPKRFTACGRKTLLNWISGELSRDIVDLTQLSDGAAYCLLVNILTPETMPLKRITFKIDPFTHHDNYNLLQVSFRRHKVRKTIPVQKLIERNTKEILVFTNWLKAFYELNMAPISAK